MTNSSEEKKAVKGKPKAIRFSRPVEALLDRAMKKTGRDRSYLVENCVIDGLRKYAGKRIQLPESKPV